MEDSSLKSKKTIHPLIAACQTGNLQEVKLLLKHKNTKVNFVHHHMVPISVAARHGYIAILELLLDNGAVVDYVGDTPCGILSALIVAVYNGQYEAVALLLKRGANVNASFCGQTPLTAAAEKGYSELVKLLLEHGADVHLRCLVYLYPALRCACLGGHTECARILIQHGADVNEESHQGNALTDAAWGGHIECIKLLLQNGAVVNKSENTCRWDPNVVIENPFDFVQSTTNHTNEDTEVTLEPVTNTVDAGVIPGSTALMEAARHGREESMKVLLEHGAKVNLKDDKGNTALMKTMQGWDITQRHVLKCIKVLLGQKGIDADVKNKCGYTALMLAAQNGIDEVVKLLLDHGVQVNIRNSERDTEIMLASRKGHTKCVEHLLGKKGTDINLQNNSEYTALMLASEKGHTDIVRLLLEHGADMEVLDTRGCSALFYAVKSNSPAVVRLLLEKGANARQKTIDEKTVLQFAYDCGTPDKSIVRMLREAQQNQDKQTTNVLTESQHLEICQYLQPLEGRDIVRMGQALGLLRSNLKKMKDLPDDMVDAWLNREDNVLKTSGSPTWESLCKALRTVNQEGMAADIESQHSDFGAKKSSQATCIEMQQVPTYSEVPPREKQTQITGLTERDHLKIHHYLRSLENDDIILLGQALGLLRSSLKKMETLPDDMIEAWLNREDHVVETSGPPTWESLCKALREIGQIGIAESLLPEISGNI